MNVLAGVVVYLMFMGMCIVVLVLMVYMAHGLIRVNQYLKDKEREK